MALSASVLAGLIQTNIEAINDYPAPGEHPVFLDTRIILAVAQAIVTHLTTAAQVEPGTFSTPPTGGAVTGLGGPLL